MRKPTTTQPPLLDPKPTLDRRQRMAAAYAHRVGLTIHTDLDELLSSLGAEA